MQHGDKDKVLSIYNSLYMIEVAKEKGARVEMLTVREQVIDSREKTSNRACRRYIKLQQNLS
ncbi:MAG: hypothetical protein ACR2KZ_14780 [Segetibacter sp.]